MTRISSQDPGRSVDGWTRLSGRLDGGPASRAAIGLLALANDAVIEPEVRRFLPVQGVEVYSSRIAMARDLSPESLKAMENDLPRAVDLLLPDDRLDVVAFGCTSGAIVIGSQSIAETVRSRRSGIAVTDPIRACTAAFQVLGIRRLALVTPYPIAVNQVIEAYLDGIGIEVGARATFLHDSDVTIGRIDPEAIFDAAMATNRSDGDALFLSCTALRCSTVVQRIEDATGKPVVTSNQALAWHALRLAGDRTAIPGFGRLFQLPASDRPSR